MNFEAICNDPVKIDREYPAGMESFKINSHGSDLVANIYTAQGKGPHPTIVIFHGIPGNEKNFDLAQVFRRAGYNAMVFHYRGSWGSEGIYSVKNDLEDAEVVLDFLKSNESAKYRVDQNNIILMGHSLGGFVAFMTAANHPEIKPVAFIAGANMGGMGINLTRSGQSIDEAAKMLESLIFPLKGITAQQLAQELMDNGEEWDLMKKIDDIKNHSVFMIGGSRDVDAPVDANHKVLVNALKESGATDLTEMILDTDHSFSDKRITLTKELLCWLDKQ